MFKSNPKPPTTTVPRKGTALDKGALSKVWIKCTRMEQQVVLIKKLMHRGIGTQDVECFMKSQNRNRKSGVAKREEKIFTSSMEAKLEDAERSAKQARDRKGRERRKLEKSLGPNSTKYKNLINKLQKEAENEKNMKVAAHKKKMDHLEDEHKKKECQDVPMDLIKYRHLKIFSKEEIKESEKDEPIILGDIVLSDEEKEALATQPNFCVLNKLSEENFEIESEKALAKHRWGASNKEKSKQRAEMRDSKEAEGSQEEEDKLMEEEAEARRIYDPVRKQFDYGKKKATDNKHNTRVHLPKPLDPHQEAHLEVRITEWKKAFKEYKEKNSDEKGNQPSNLSPAQRRGLASLKKRIEEGEIVVCPTDKSGKLAVMSLELYEAAGRIHTTNDIEVDFDQIKEVEKRTNGHCSMLIKIFNIGSDWLHESRHREIVINHSQEVAILAMLYKDHKGWSPNKGGHPPFRPVALANKGVNIHLSDIVSDILEPVASAMEGSNEVDSTDDMLSKSDKINSKYEGKDGRAAWTNPSSIEKKVSAATIIPNCPNYPNTLIPTDAKSDGQTEQLPPSESEMPQKNHNQCCNQTCWGRAELSSTTNQSRPVRGETVPSTKGLPGSECIEVSAAELCQAQKGKMVVIGADVVNHYPSLQKESTATTAKSAMMSTQIKF